MRYLETLHCEDDQILDDKIHLVCEQFEAAWHSGDAPRIEEWVSAVEEPLRPIALKELLKLDVEYRARGGESTAPAPYEQLFPDAAAIIEEVFAWAQSIPTAWLPTIPGYEILKEIGRGGMGVVYRAKQEGLGREVALKMIHHGFADDKDRRERLVREAQTIARLEHPNIVRIHDFGEHAGRLFFTMELVQGGSLDRKLGGTPLPPNEAARLVEKLGRAVQLAHAYGIVHRDLKPGNVLLDVDGSPKITDFGLAKHLDEGSQTRSNALLGTPSYVAPEQAQGRRSGVIGPSVDVYALGAVFYECLTGRPPFKASTVIKTIEQVIHDPPVPPRQLIREIPRDLETICLKCLRKDPTQRYRTALEMADDLRRFQERRPILARAAGPIERAWQWCRRKPMEATLSIAVVLLLVLLEAGGLFFYLQMRRAGADAQVQTARLAGQAGQWEIALNKWNGALRNGNVDPLTARLEIFKALRALGRAADSRAVISELMQEESLGEHRAEVLFWYGDDLWMQGKEWDADAQFEEAQRLGLSEANAEYVRAIQSRTSAESIERFQRVLELDRFHQPALAQLAWTLLLSGMREEARRIALTALNFYPGNLGSVVTLAWCSAVEGDPQRARQHLERAAGRVSPGTLQLLEETCKDVAEAAGHLRRWEDASSRQSLLRTAARIRGRLVQIQQANVVLHLPPLLQRFIRSCDDNLELLPKPDLLRLVTQACATHDEGGLHFLRGVLQMPVDLLREPESSGRDSSASTAAARDAFQQAATIPSFLHDLRTDAVLATAIMELRMVAEGRGSERVNAERHVRERMALGPLTDAQALVAFRTCVWARQEEEAWLLYGALQDNAPPEKRLTQSNEAFALARTHRAFHLARRIAEERRRQIPNDLMLIREQMQLEMAARAWQDAIRLADLILQSKRNDSEALQLRRDAIRNALAELEKESNALRKQD